MQRSLGRAALLFSIPCVALTLPLGAQRSDTIVRFAGTPMQRGVGKLAPEITIGGPDATDDNYIFASIKSVLAAKDGSVWVIDGRVDGKHTFRRYSRSGAFVGNVGRSGDGPGEWRFPDNLAQFHDGRVVLRDALAGRWLTFYKPNAEFDTTWAFPTSTIHDVRVDTADVLWLRMSGGTAFRSSSPVAIVRIHSSGRVVDTLQEPARIRTESPIFLSVNNGRSSTIINIPYQPRSLQAWSPHGYYARSLSSRYSVDLLVPRALGGGRSRPWQQGDPVVSVRSSVRAVAVTSAERADRTAHMKAQVDAFGARSPARMPNVPSEKPLLRSIAFDLDGRLWVRVSQPSERYEPPPPVTPGALPAVKWREPSVYDVYESNGRYVGRLATPYDMELATSGGVVQARGDVVWGVVRDEDGVEGITRYRMVW